MKSVSTEDKSAVKQSIATSKSMSNSLQKRNGKIFDPVCHFFGVKGHIQPRCFTLMNFRENYYEKKKIVKIFSKTTHRPKIHLGNDSKMKWAKNSELKCFISYTCLRTCVINAWYFDSGCSKHMTRNKDILVDYKPLSEGLVTFGNGVTMRVPGRGTLNVKNFSQFKNVINVDELKVNLISISQICDLNLNLNVKFKRKKCVVIDDDGKCILEGFRSPDNFYTLTSLLHTCHKIDSNDKKL